MCEPHFVPQPCSKHHVSDPSQNQCGIDMYLGLASYSNKSYQPRCKNSLRKGIQAQSRLFRAQFPPSSIQTPSMLSRNTKCEAQLLNAGHNEVESLFVSYEPVRNLTFRGRSGPRWRRVLRIHTAEHVPARAVIIRPLRNRLLWLLLLRNRI